MPQRKKNVPKKVSESSPDSAAEQTNPPRTVPMPRPMSSDRVLRSNRSRGGAPAAVLHLTEESESPERDGTNEAVTNIASGAAENEKDKPGSAPMNEREFNCPVCLECYMNRIPTSTSCGHIFCKECITHLQKCPLCNAAIDHDSIHRIYLN